MSLLELLKYLEEILNIKIPLRWDTWRPGDQPVFVCNLLKAQEKLNWQPRISVQEGVKSLGKWVTENSRLFD